MTGKYPGLRIFVGTVVGLVIIVSVVGLFVAGSPGKERERKFDGQRVNDLRNISSRIDIYYERAGQLPRDLGELTTTEYDGYGTDPMTDPATGEQYGYEVTGKDTYGLCATFDQESTDERSIGYPRAPMPVKIQNRDWKHPTGLYCFPLTAQAYTTRIDCGLERPCPTGETCAVLSDQDEAFCIPQGKECISAGCPGECAVLESYPVQVRCPKIGTGPAPVQ